MNSRLHPAAHDITHNKEPEKAKERMQKHLQTLDQEMARQAIFRRGLLVGGHHFYSVLYAAPTLRRNYR